MTVVIFHLLLVPGHLSLTIILIFAILSILVEHKNVCASEVNAAFAHLSDEARTAVINMENIVILNEHANALERMYVERIAAEAREAMESRVSFNVKRQKETNLNKGKFKLKEEM